MNVADARKQLSGWMFELILFFNKCCRSICIYCLFLYTVHITLFVLHVNTYKSTFLIERRVRERSKPFAITQSTSIRQIIKQVTSLSVLSSERLINARVTNITRS